MHLKRPCWKLSFHASCQLPSPSPRMESSRPRRRSRKLIDRISTICSSPDIQHAGHTVAPSISGARPSGRRQRVRSVSLNKLNPSIAVDMDCCAAANQHQNLHSVGGHYNVRLFKQSRPKRRRNFTIFSTVFWLPV